MPKVTLYIVLLKIVDWLFFPHPFGLMLSAAHWKIYCFVFNFLHSFSFAFYKCLVFGLPRLNSLLFYLKLCCLVECEWVKVYRSMGYFASKIVIRSEAPEMLTLGPRTLISNVPCTKWKEIALVDITAFCCESHINIATSFSVKSTHELAGLISGTETL